MLFCILQGNTKQRNMPSGDVELPPISYFLIEGGKITMKTREM